MSSHAADLICQLHLLLHAMKEVMLMQCLKDYKRSAEYVLQFAVCH